VSIQRIGEALTAAGFHGLDEKAKALGLCRSTAWTVLGAGHKATGLTAQIVVRILAAPYLPTTARAQVVRYIEERVAGFYGNTLQQRRRFVGRLAREGFDVTFSNPLLPRASRRARPGS
jgi:hypothetical protein